jgi:hypothetical protein
MSQGDLFAQEVLPLFEAYRGDWLDDARATAFRLCSVRGEITIDDVRAVCPPPLDVDPRVMGAVMRPPEFEIVRYVKSARRECHNRPVAVFRLAVRQ